MTRVPITEDEEYPPLTRWPSCAIRLRSRTYAKRRAATAGVCHIAAS
jgi:hypothetical protein